MILALQNRDGLEPKKSASTNGGEYSSPCPKCGGRDRFRSWPEQDRYWCRQCGKSGDVIQYLRDFHGLSYQEAADQVGKVISTPTRQVIKGTIPKQPPAPSWFIMAGNLVDYAHAALLSNEDALSWLASARGLDVDTVKRHRLGWLDRNHYRDRSAWGLPEATREDGKQKKLFIPSGLVIPYQEHGKVIRVRIRRDNPGERGRYYILPGSSMVPMVISGVSQHPAIIVESELDAILLSQELMSPYTVISLGSANAKPDDMLADKLRQVPYVIICLDADPTGNKATKYWLDNYQNAVWFPMPEGYGKDQTEAYIHGLDLNLWLEAAAIEVCGMSRTEKIERTDKERADG